MAQLTDCCVICSDKLLKAESRKSIKIQNDLGAKPVDAFLKICQLLKLPFSEIQHDWRFGQHGGYLKDGSSNKRTESNILPFCCICLSGFHSILKLQEQLIEIQDKIEQQIASIHLKIETSPPSQSAKTTNFRWKALNNFSSKSTAATTTTAVIHTPQSPPTNFQTIYQPPIQTVYLTPTFSQFPPEPPPQPNYHENSNSNNFEDDNHSSSNQSDSDSSIADENPVPSKPSPKHKSSSPKTASISKRPKGDLANTRQPEYFAPVTTDELGRMVFEGILILPCAQGVAGGYTCGQCKAIIGKKQNAVSLRKAKIHIKGFHLKAYECPQCGKNLTSNDILNQHLNRFHGAPILPCPDCGKPIKNLPSAMKRHQYTHLNKEEKQSWVSDGFNPYDQKKPLRFGCRICGKMFRRENIVRRHEVTHVDPEFRKDFKCETCGKGYTTDQARREHENLVHSEVRQGVGRLCKICGKTVWRRHWSKHLQQHGEKRWRCELCGEKEFQREVELERHQRGCRRRKEGKGEWQCDVCGERRETRKQLQWHRRRKHRGDVRVKVPVGWRGRIGVEGDEGWKCEECGEKWRDLEEVIRHWREKHGRRGRGDFDCEVCGRRGIGNKMLLRHVWGHVGVEEAVEKVNEGEVYPREWRGSKQGEMMEVLRGMGVEVEVKCEICGKGGWGSVAELYEHRRGEHKEAKVKRVRRKREPKKRGRKPGWRSRVGMKKKKVEDDSEGEENEGEVKVKEEVETGSEEDEEEDFFEEGKEEVMGIREKDGGEGRRSLRRSARGQINYVDEDQEEEEEDEEMEFKQSPHTSEDHEDDGDWN